MFLVYMHRNKLNNKKYFGITSQSTNNRWRNGKGYKTNSHFYNSILKYGWNNFDHLVIFENLSKEQAEKIEIFLIKTFNTTNGDFGYNVCLGGDLKRKILTDEERKEYHKQYNKEHSNKNILYQKEYRKKNYEMLKNKKHLKYLEHSKEICEKIREYRKNNKEHVKEITRLYREKNKDKINNRHRLWYEKNKNEINRKRRDAYARKRISNKTS